MKRALFFIVITFFSFHLRISATEDFTYLKIAGDGMAINNALFGITTAGTNQNATLYKDKIDGLLDQLAACNTGFRKDMFPAELNVKSDNLSQVKSICEKLKKVMTDVREYAKAADAQFDLADFPLIMTLKSENPGDYYLGINPDFIYGLHNHPFRRSIEELQLQDIGFEEVLASGDTSLWNMTTHCPNLKIITLFAAEIDDRMLTKLKLTTAQKLQALELSENMISAIPDGFNASNSLVFLSLRRNKLKTLPANLTTWTNLKYLHLGANQFEATERTRIQNALPGTKIIF